MRSEHELLEDAVAAYLLGASEPGEAESVRAHLAACASCRQLAARLTRAVGALPLAAEEVAPPGRLRERILAAAAGEPQAAARPRSRTPDLAPNPGPRPRRMPDLAPNPAWAGGQRWLPLAAAAVALLAIGVAGGVGVSRATAPGVAAAHYALKGTGPLEGAAGAVVDFRGAGTTLVEFRGLPAAPAGKVYELWLIPNGAKPIASGVFVPDADGSKVLVLPRGLAGVAVMAVTVEQGPAGAAQPTQQPALSGSLT